MIYVNEKAKCVIQEKRMIKYSFYLFIDLKSSFYIPNKITNKLKLKPEFIINIFYHYRNTSSTYIKKWGIFSIQSGITDDEYEYYINNNMRDIFDDFILNDEYGDCPYILIFLYPNGDEFWISRNIGNFQDHKNKDMVFEYTLFYGKVKGKRIIKNNLSEVKPGHLAIVYGKCSITSREQFLIDKSMNLSPDKRSFNLSF